MKSRKTAYALLAATAWLGTLALAFLVGRGAGADSPESSRTNPSGGSPASVSGSPASGPTEAGGGAVSAQPARRAALASLLDFAERGGDGEMPRSLRELAAAMDLEQVEAAVEALEELDPSPAQVRSLKAVLQRWAQLAGPDAMSYVAAMQAPKRRFDAKLWVLRAWGGSDPAAALAHIHANPDTSISRHAEHAVFEGLADGDLNVAMRFLESINAKDTRYGSSTYSAVREMFLKDDRAVIDWVATIPSGEVRDRAIHGLIDQWARYDPLAAKAWMESNAAPGNLANARVELGESWARVDPQAALDWSATIEGDENTAERVRQRIFNRWLQYDYQAAAEYLAGQEPSPELDSAFELYVGRARYYDPAATMSWAESITDPERRLRAMRQVASIWKSRDRGAFDAYLQGGGFSEQELKRLR